MINRLLSGMRTALLLAGLMSVGSLYAVIAKPGIGIVGDEYYHYRVDSQGSRMPSREIQGIRRLPAEVQFQTTFPAKGEVRSIVILVAYPDVPFSVSNPNLAFSNMLNEQGYSDNGGTGSARDYFIESSNGQFQPTFDVYGPYTLSHNRSYYKSEPARMIIEVCELADDIDGVDFTQYDYNSDGYIDNVFVYYAGLNPAEGGPSSAVWPHRSMAAIEEGGSWVRYSVDGKWIWDYACTSELRGWFGTNQCGIGTFCHEFSHVLGLDDLYNTADSEIYTVGTWDIMCSGNYNNEGRTPPAYSAYERFMLGWLTPEQLTNTADYLLEPIETSNKAYLIATTKHNMQAYTPNPTEYWLVENRQHVGWDAHTNAIPGKGLLISHITFHKGKWDNNTPNNTKPLGYDICEAYYKSPVTASGSDTYPGTFNVTSFVPTTNTGDILLDYQLNNIQTFNDTQVIFHFGKDTGSGLRFIGNDWQNLQTDMLDNEPTRFEVRTVDINGTDLQDDKIFFTTNDDAFQISLDGVHWSNDTIWDEVTDAASYSRTLYIRYYPSETCATESGILSIGIRNLTQATQALLYGQSEREVLITAVQPTEAAEVGPYSFIARWERQTDAELYYLTVYSLKDEPFTEALFPDKTLSKEGDTYISPLFPTDLTDIDIKFKHNYATTTKPKHGEIIIQASADDGVTWDSITAITIRSSNQASQQHSIAVPQEGHYRRYQLLYHLIQSTGDVTLQALNTTLAQHPVYIYRDNEYRINSKTTKALIAGLEPNTDYFYYLICQENKGCERHTSAQGPTQRVRTLAGTTNTSKQFTVNVASDGHLKAFLPSPLTEGHKMFVYTIDGRLVGEYAIPTGASQVDIHTSAMVRGRMYVAKLTTGNKLKRKDLWAKFLY